MQRGRAINKHQIDKVSRFYIKASAANEAVFKAQAIVDLAHEHVSNAKISHTADGAKIKELRVNKYRKALAELIKANTEASRVNSAIDIGSVAGDAR